MQCPTLQCGIPFPNHCALRRSSCWRGSTGARRRGGAAGRRWRGGRAGRAGARQRQRCRRRGQRERRGGARALVCAQLLRAGLRAHGGRGRAAPAPPAPPPEGRRARTGAGTAGVEAPALYPNDHGKRRRRRLKDAVQVRRGSWRGSEAFAAFLIVRARVGKREPHGRCMAFVFEVATWRMFVFEGYQPAPGGRSPVGPKPYPIPIPDPNPTPPTNRQEPRPGVRLPRLRRALQLAAGAVADRCVRRAVPLRGLPHRAGRRGPGRRRRRRRGRPSGAAGGGQGAAGAGRISLATIQLYVQGQGVLRAVGATLKAQHCNNGGIVDCKSTSRACLAVAKGSQMTCGHCSQLT